MSHYPANFHVTTPAFVATKYLDASAIPTAPTPLACKHGYIPYFTNVPDIRLRRVARFRYTIGLVLLGLLIGFCVWFRQRALSVAEQTVIAHFQDMRRGDTKALLARYSPQFFHQRKGSRGQLAESLLRLHASGLSNYHVWHREIWSTGFSGTTVWISCYSFYGSGGFNEDFHLFRARGKTNFAVVWHDFD